MNPDPTPIERGAQALRDRLSEPAGLAVFNRIIALVSFGVGSLILAVCGWGVHRFHMDEFLFHRATAQGEVVKNDAVRVGSGGTAGRLGGTFYRAVVRFRSQDGKDVTVEDWIGMAPASYRVGEGVTVIYDPEAPDHAMIDRGWKNYLAPGIPTAFGLLMILGGLQRLLRARS